MILRNLESRKEVNLEENIGKTMFITEDVKLNSIKYF